MISAEETHSSNHGCDECPSHLYSRITKAQNISNRQPPHTAFVRECLVASALRIASLLHGVCGQQLFSVLTAALITLFKVYLDCHGPGVEMSEQPVMT